MDPQHRLFGPPDVLKLRANGDIPGLIKALRRKKDAQTREAAAKALGELGDTRAVPPLVDALDDSVAAVCVAAATALGEIGDRQAVEPLLSALDDERVHLHGS